MQPAVVVTGASSGLGAEFVKLAVADGAKTVLIARSGPELYALAASLDPSGQSTVVLPMDLATADAGGVIACRLEELGLYCHLLVNNAGFGLYGEAAEQDRNRQLGIFDVNVRASTELILRFLLGMVARGKGGIINIGSIAGFVPGPQMAVYFASKAYLVSLSQALREEVSASGVSVTCLCPGPLETPFLNLARADKARLFKLLPKLNTAIVARAGWDAYKANSALCIPGFFNKVTVFITRLLPRGALLATVGYLQRIRGSGS